MCHSIPAARALPQAIPNTCTAKTLGAGERLVLGVPAVAGHQTITDLAEDADVSRKFVYRQANIAQAALDEAFAPSEADDEVICCLPITKNWLKQATLGLTLICHSSQRGVHEFCRDLLGVNLSVGTSGMTRFWPARMPAPKSAMVVDYEFVPPTEARRESTTSWPTAPPARCARCRRRSEARQRSRLS